MGQITEGAGAARPTCTGGTLHPVGPKEEIVVSLESERRHQECNWKRKGNIQLKGVGEGSQHDRMGSRNSKSQEFQSSQCPE